jgi:hypothetical protein
MQYYARNKMRHAEFECRASKQCKEQMRRTLTSANFEKVVVTTQHVHHSTVRAGVARDFLNV